MSAPLPPSHDHGSAGPEVSDASLRAALVNERLHVEQLRTLADHQARLLRRRPVRLVLSLDRRTRLVRDRMARQARRGRRRAARARLAAWAVPSRRDLDARRLDVAAADDALPPAPSSMPSVTLLVVSGADGRIPAADPPPAETILVLTDGAAPLPVDGDVTVVRATHKTEAAAVRDAARKATGDLLCVVRSSSVPRDPAWLARLAGAMADADDVVAATPQLIHPARDATRATPHDLLVRNLGLEVVPRGDGTPEVRARRAGTRPTPDGATRPAASAHCSRRNRAAALVAVPSSLVVDEQPVPSLDSLTHPVAASGAAWDAVRDRQEGTLARMAARRPGTDNLRIVMGIASPSARVAHRWGDFHLAEGLAQGLRRLGHVVHIQSLDEAGRQQVGTDLHLVLRGAATVPSIGAAHRALWIISHPESVTEAECDDADLILVASEAFATELRRRTSTPVEVLLQGTDANRFRRQAPDPRHTHAVAAVAMTRHVFRPSVRLAVEAGFRPAIYGGGWEEFVDPELVVAKYLPNHRLPSVYSSVGVLLNDHWETMRRWGFVSNRLFDALACGTPIVSDHLPEIAELFGDAIATFTTADDLRSAVDLALDDPVLARRRADEGRAEVLAHHTLARRAEELVGHLSAHGLAVAR